MPLPKAAQLKTSCSLEQALAHHITISGESLLIAIAFLDASKQGLVGPAGLEPATTRL